MYSVVNTLLSRLSLIIPLFITVCLARVRAEDCGQEELVQCARPLQVLSATSHLTFVTKKEELDELCPDLNTGLRCIHSYTRRCMTEKQRRHFKVLYQGTEQVIRDICNAGEYQDEFLLHAPCMHRVKDEYSICARRYQRTMLELNAPPTTTEAPVGLYRKHRSFVTVRPSEEDEQAEAQEKVKTVCCSFQEYVACSQHTVQRKCGTEAANFTRNFLDKMSMSLIENHCSEYAENTGKCVYEFSSSTWNTGNLWMSLLISILPVIFLR